MNMPSQANLACFYDAHDDCIKEDCDCACHADEHVSSPPEDTD